MKMEEEFREVAHTSLLIETSCSYTEIIKPVIIKALGNHDLRESDLELLREIDRLLRFFYLCTVLHTDLRIEQAIIARSYYFHAKLLLDDSVRPELANYVRKNYKRLTEWLVQNNPSFESYGSTGKWINSNSSIVHEFYRHLFVMKQKIRNILLK